jgi:hypothetical protein
MSKSAPTRRKPGQMPFKDRRAQPETSGSVLRSFRGMLSRPLAVERRQGKVHVVLVDRRKAPELAPLRAELLVRLKSYAQDHSTRSIRELALVHRVLGREGWPGVEALEQRVLSLALDQAEKLRGRRTSDFLEAVIARLRAVWLLAVHRDRHLEDRGEMPSAFAFGGAATVHFQFDDER